MRLLAHLAGDVPQMAAAELRALLEAHGAPLAALQETPRFLDGLADVALGPASALLPRLGLTHLVAHHAFDGVPGDWNDGTRDSEVPSDLRFAVRSVRVDPDAPWAGPDVERELGAVVGRTAQVDLRNPDVIIRAFLTRERIYVGRQLWESDPKALRARHVENRPFFSPVSLEPRLARALINLGRIAQGGVVYDPFCGTGGVLLEAAAMGLRAVGSDVDPRMVEGSRVNLSHYGLAERARLFIADVAEAPRVLPREGIPPVDAVVTDFPYGRSASTGKEPTATLYERGFEAIAGVLPAGHHAVVGAPTEADVRLGERFLSLRAIYPVRVHRSLTRHFAVYRRP